MKRATAFDEFASVKNPLENPEVFETFDKLIKDRDDFFGKNKDVLDPQKENTAWEGLCALCKNEVQKANAELIQILNAENYSTANKVRNVIKKRETHKRSVL